MPTGSRKSARNIAFNRDSILLLFTDHEAKIARDWRVGKKPAAPRTTAMPPVGRMGELLIPDV